MSLSNGNRDHQAARADTYAPGRARGVSQRTRRGSRSDERADRHTRAHESTGHGTLVDYPLDTCLHEHIERVARETPTAPAVVFEGNELSYGELDRRSNALARRLGELGVQRESLVAIYMERSIELVVGLLAVLKAGGAYVPVDPDYPSDRVRFMIEDAEAPVLLTQQKLVDGLPTVHASVLCVDSEWDQLSTLDSSPLELRTNADCLAYVIYTSGSTGKPKGAMNAHRGICNRLLWMRDQYDVDSRDSVLQKTPISFDVSVWELFLPLICGARLVLAKPGGHREPRYLVQLIQDSDVTLIHFVPSMLRLILEEPDLAACTSLRHVICSGEALPPSMQQRFFSMLETNLHNLYGPTEAAVDVTYWRCRPDPDATMVPIGRPVANTTIHILDDDMTPVPVGEEGELYIGGVQVGRGYWKRRELTAERFVPDPFVSNDRARLYRTGDLGRCLPDGNIEFLGRRDHQVKVRGFRIELGEIESTLSAHDAVSEAVVVAQRQPDDTVRLVAYLLPDSTNAFTVRQAAELDRTGAETAWNAYELPNGMLVSHLNRNETDFTFQEIFEEDVYLRNGITLKNGACVVDVGANIGLFSLYVASKHRNVSVYALEPLPPIFKVLELNSRLYDFDIKALPYGASRQSGSDEFMFYPHVSIVSGRFADLGEEKDMLQSYLEKEQDVGLSANVMDDLLDSRLESQVFSCELKSLSDLMREQGIEHVDLLKVDAEKSELDVLAGIDRNDWKKIQQLVIEVHDVDRRLERIVQMLESHGYELTIEQEPMLSRTDLHMVYARRPGHDGDVARIAADHRSESTAQRWFRASTLVSDVKQFAAKKLPEYMVPAVFMILDRMPLTPNGKLDRGSLPRIGGERPALEQKFVSPSSPVERYLAGIWQDLLKLDRVGVHDRFFELGGDSILGHSSSIVCKKSSTSSSTSSRCSRRQPLRSMRSFSKPTTQTRSRRGLGGPATRGRLVSFQEVLERVGSTPTWSSNYVRAYPLCRHSREMRTWRPPRIGRRCSFSPRLARERRSCG